VKRRDLRLRRPSSALDEEFAAFTYSAQGALLRTAYLLTGEEWTARQLVESTLVRLYLDRRGIENHLLEHRARRLLLQGYGGRRRRPAAAAAAGTLWDVVHRLPATQRAVAVLLLHDELAEEDVADLLDLDVEVVRSELEQALAAVRACSGERAA
jgi:DNA-directed RNA polymerase specialized sigma24 family protein